MKSNDGTPKPVESYAKAPTTQAAPDEQPLNTTIDGCIRKLSIQVITDSLMKGRVTIKAVPVEAIKKLKESSE